MARPQRNANIRENHHVRSAYSPEPLKRPPHAVYASPVIDRSEWLPPMASSFASDPCARRCRRRPTLAARKWCTEKTHSSKMCVNSVHRAVDRADTDETKLTQHHNGAKCASAPPRTMATIIISLESTLCASTKQTYSSIALFDGVNRTKQYFI